MDNFQEGPLKFASLMTVYVNFWTAPYMRGTLGIDPTPIILRGAKDFIKYCLLANFRDSISKFAGFIPIFGKF